jgi:hypothetical protein
MGTDKFHFHFGKGATGGVTADMIEQAGAAEGDCIGQIDSLHDTELTVMGEMQAMGLRYAVESTGLFGVSWHGPKHQHLRGCEWIFADSYRGFDPAAIAAAGDNPDKVFFRGYANRVCYGVYWEVDEKHPNGQLNDWFTGRMRQIMQIYNEVEQYMDEPELLDNDAGVRWRCGDNQVLWAFADGALDLGGRCQVSEMPSGKIFHTATLTAKAWTVYKITAP